MSKKYFLFKFERYFEGSRNEFRQQVWGLGIFPNRYLSKFQENMGRTVEV